MIETKLSYWTHGYLIHMRYMRYENSIKCYMGHTARIMGNKTIEFECEFGKIHVSSNLYFLAWFLINLQIFSDFCTLLLSCSCSKLSEMHWMKAIIIIEEYN